MNRLFRWAIPAAALATVAAPSAVVAQGGFQMTPQMQAAMQARRKFMENHRNYRNVSGLMRGLRECEKDPKTQLTKPQAKALLATIQRWEKKGPLSNDQAGALYKEMAKGLTLAQVKVIATARDRRRGPGGPGGGMGGMRPGGPGGPGGTRPGGPGMFTGNIPPPKEYNPLNPATMNPFQRQFTEPQLKEFRAKLIARAK